MSRLSPDTLGLVTSLGARGRNKPLAKPTLIGTRNLITHMEPQVSDREGRVRCRGNALTVYRILTVALALMLTPAAALAGPRAIVFPFDLVDESLAVRDGRHAEGCL